MNLSPELSKDRVRQYRQQGYLSPLEFMEAEEALEYRQHFEGFESDSAYHNLPRQISTYLRSGVHLVIPAVAEIAARPEILDQIECLLGPDIMLYGAELFIKEAGSCGFVSWHQDLTYWGFGETDEELTAWIALSGASAEAGCMRFIAGSHKNHLLRHSDSFEENNLLSRGQSLAAPVDEDQAVFAALGPGQFSVHHGNLFHASSPNRSADRRIGLALRYVTPGVRQQVASRDYAILLRGVDDLGNWVNIAPPARAFDQASLALYEQVNADQSVALAQNANQELNIYRE